MSAPRDVRARAPLRLPFRGGGSGVPPYPGERGGRVLSATVHPHAFAGLRPRRDSRPALASLGFGEWPHAAWEHPKPLEPGIATGPIDTMSRLAKEGAIRGQMPGAGGGGDFLLPTTHVRRHRVAPALRRRGGQVVPFPYEPRGLPSGSAPRGR